MYATISTTPAPADPRTESGPDAAPAGTVVLASADGAEATVVSFWPDAGSVPRRDGVGVYRVSDAMTGSAAGRRPLFAQLTWINGEGDHARAEAAERGGRDRIWPAVRDIAGIVGVYALRSESDRIVVLGLTTDRETHVAVQRTIMQTPLLPDEDPAMMTGADRVDLVRVVSADLPAEVRS